MDVLVRPRAAAHVGRRRHLLRRGIALLLAAMVLAALALVGFRLARPGVLPGVELAGSDLGGLAEQDLAVAVASAAKARGERPVEVVAGDAVATATATEAGYRFDVDATVADVWERGRQRNALTALADHLRASFGATTAIPARESVDAAALAGWSEQAAEVLATDPVEAAIAFEDGAVAATEPAPGAEIDVDALRAALAPLLLGSGRLSVEAEVDEVAPTTTTADLEAVLPAAERAVAAPVALVRDGQRLELTPSEIGRILRVVTDVEADPPLRIEADAERFAEVVAEHRRSAFDVDPVDARIALVGGSVQVSESRDGFRFDVDRATEQLLEVATAEGPREAELAGEVVAPGRSTEDARELGIVEQVSTFTTNHACCESRVTNIQRFADLVDGVVIEPGETFSLNGHVGERTEEKGFVGGGAIFNGEFVDQIGGGVSQFATTFYNAAYFGGYELVEYKAHSYYISRYPVGREATISYPSVDLKIRNSSPHGILVDTSYTDTSITVSLWGTKWVDVRSETGPRTNVRQPETKVRTNPDLPAGAQRVSSSGREGFDVLDVRVLTFPDGEVRREEIRTRYLAEPRIVERGA